MEKLDLTQILKDCPKGTKLWSALFGEVEFVGINETVFNSILTKDELDISWNFAKDGRYYNREDEECMLFPSKDNRDWSTFKVGQQQPKFEPFQKVLVRNSEEQQWRASLYSHYMEDNEFYRHVCVADIYNMCIPYEGNEHLLGTTDEPKEKEE